MQRIYAVDDVLYAVKNGRICDPGKFEGEALHAVRDYASESHDESFGDIDTFGTFYWRVRKNGAGLSDRPEYFRYYCEDSQGFVTEVGCDEYSIQSQAYGEYCERAEQIEGLLSQIEDIERETIPAVDEMAAKRYVFDYAGFYVFTLANNLADALAMLEATRFGTNYNGSWTAHESADDLREHVAYEVIELEPEHFADHKRARIEAIRKQIAELEDC